MVQPAELFWIAFESERDRVYGNISFDEHKCTSTKANGENLPIASKFKYLKSTISPRDLNDEVSHTPGRFGQTNK